jgi:CIC family chloride channel protein
MNNTARIKRIYPYIKLRKLIIVSSLIGFLSAFLGITLKKMTEHFESILFLKTSESWLYFLVFPFFSLSLIYFLRQYLFRKKGNKGIKEIFECMASKSKTLPAYKVPSHFINGLLTVIFGGSTGVEVSTVVASATIGAIAQQKENVFKQYKTELICAGVAAGITALFGSPIAGILFAFEVISKKINKTFLLTNIIAVSAAYGLVYLLNEEPLFAINLITWHFHAVPYFVVLGILAGINSVYLTKCMMFIKASFSKIPQQYSKILVGSAILSICLLLLPQLYGDGYRAVKDIVYHSGQMPLTLSLAITLIGILILKPIVTSVTLASGGDGGVFAPSLFIGAFLGFLVALVLNTFFETNVIPLNFMIMGMAAMLSASIHAPFTALFLVCEVINDYTLFFPLLVVCLISKYTSKMIYPFTVYTFTSSPAK